MDGKRFMPLIVNRLGSVLLPSIPQSQHNYNRRTTMSGSRHTRLATIALILLALLSIPAPQSVHAQERCSPETNQCITGRFLQYWEQNGGLAVFGHPITPARNEINRDTGQTYLTQWFERNRFELHPENKPPYDVLLGRLGNDRFEQQGLRWQELPRDEGPREGCLWFPETQRNVCDQAAGVGFRSYWERHGLQDPTLNGYSRSLALFGLPLTGARPETNSSGEKVITQWFERARFEWHPNKPEPFKVLLGLVGNEAQSVASGPQEPPGQAIRVLFAYFAALNDGRYSAASQLYGGSYDVLREQNPDVAANDFATLLRRACEANGFQCLRARGVTRVETISATEFRLTVMFNRPDGSLFQHPQNGLTEFPYTVRLDPRDGRMRVLELPIYLA